LPQHESYFLACQRYIELNPVRAGMVAHPAQYRWSSYRANAQGEPSELVSPHALYQALGADGAARRIAYRELARHALAPGLVDAIRLAMNGNYALGNTRFGEQLRTRWDAEPNREKRGGHARWQHRKITICLKTTNHAPCLENVVCPLFCSFPLFSQTWFGIPTSEIIQVITDLIMTVE
jgi:hypothetical protein